MKTGMLCAGLLVAAATQAGASNYHGHHHGNHAHNTLNGYAWNGQTIIVSCYRGPWREVIWDRPNGKFIDSLVAVGYSQPAAQAIGERVCRDQNLVGNLQNMLAEVKRIIRNAPKN
ncbi:hypothetical protein [Oceaniglobus indicus]|uniref:hypothetical protein n=1 Tax=Oceaniglobus indicus TaxID=2047749 RepID=UPI0011AB75A0|nr:hypothetical protein [Oceaniglobus indicus]